jgi:BirA family biotin operon repressor/biotin-[acetyl-CoA-carboxylase] ligase
LPPLLPTLGQPFISFSELDSTNEEVRRLIEGSLAQSGMAIFTANQQRGKGQRGKSWTSSRDQGVALTLLVEPHFLTVSQQFLLSGAVAIGVRNFLASLGGKQELFKIKWPNDIYYGDRKIAGILIENSIRSNGSWQWAIIGIGINVNQEIFSQELPNPISLFQITQEKKEPATLAKSLCLWLTTELNNLFEKGPQDLLEQYQQYLYKRGEICQFSRAGASFSAIPTGITPNGELLLDRIEHPIAFGEIEWKISLA